MCCWPLRAQQVAIHSGRDLAAILADSAVTRATLAADITLQESDWEGYATPLRLTRNLTVGAVTGPLWKDGVPIVAGTRPVFNANHLRGKIQLGAGIVLTVSDTILVNAVSGNYNIAPGFDLLAATEPIGGMGGTMLGYNSVFVMPLCYPAELQTAVALVPRPSWTPGEQKVTTAPNAPDCVAVSHTDVSLDSGGGGGSGCGGGGGSNNGSGGGSVPVAVPFERRCWAQIGYFDDLALTGTGLDGATQMRTNLYYAVQGIDSQYLCAEELSYECTTTLGVVGCMTLRLNGGAPPPSPPSRPPATSSPPPSPSGGLESAPPSSSSSSGAQLVPSGAGSLRLAVSRSSSSAAGTAALGNLRTAMSPAVLPTATTFASPAAVDGVGGKASGSPNDGAAAIPPWGNSSAFRHSSIGTGGESLIVVLSPTTPTRPDLHMLMSGSGGLVTHGSASAAASSSVSSSAAFEVELLSTVLGKGGFGRVVEGRYRRQLVAVKLILDDSLGAWGFKTSTAGGKAGAADASGTSQYHSAVESGQQQAKGAAAGPADNGTTSHLVEALRAEVEVLGRCAHPNIITLLAACLTPPRLCLVMERMDTSLDKLIFGRPPGQLIPLEEASCLG
ncbi:hypothetical protein GPECTOR_395g218 [Gonium pectorale]|uniref:Protein kinase domain-containing protein n=1 Tax=Gonium pectorale TaxID=33097 RepID=A0A150FVD6_GONPE|nr:hypothetical protein GPECTOR_395g218 [Gonium pectorale]|eukprot:KXZ41557.1 hypothetical protein GPECTOR_395g218 [Gonium pectorale]